MLGYHPSSLATIRHHQSLSDTSNNECDALGAQVKKFWAMEQRDLSTNEIVEGAFTGEVRIRHQGHAGGYGGCGTSPA